MSLVIARLRLYRSCQGFSGIRDYLQLSALTGGTDALPLARALDLITRQKMLDFHPGDEGVRLVFTGGERFVGGDSLTFKHDSSGRVTGFTLVAARAKGIVFERLRAR